MTNPNTESKQTPNDEYHPIQSIAVISIAGFGGALAGLSMARRGSISTHMFSGSSISSSGSYQTMYMQQQMQYMNQLPYLWAMCCATFAGIIEFSSLISPTGMVLQVLREKKILLSHDDDSLKLNHDKVSASVPFSSNAKSSFLHWDDKSTSILGDYVLGGAIAGALFKGSQIRPIPTKHKKAVTTVTGSAAAAYGNGSGVVPKDSIIPIDMNSEIDIKTQGTARQKRAIGKGKVVTLSNKNRLYKNRNMQTIKQSMSPSISASAQIPAPSRSTSSPSSISNSKIAKSVMNTKRVGIVAGLIPGISLGIVAGLLQISISKLNDIADGYAQDEGIGGVDDNEDELNEQIKNMSLDEIEREIKRLKENK